ncbi:MAG TPA: TIGR03067 domain-containing protein [Fimbriiglobus sp.]|nr:TIGR03067 domain-containing protein [Fimbriiglobus sp.]
MRALSSLLLAAGLAAAAAGGDKDDAVKKEMARFAGQWQAVKIVNDGEDAVPEDEVKELKLTVKGNKRVIRVGGEVKAESVFELDPTKKPKEITITVTSEGKLKGKKLLGIYELTDDTHTIVLNIKGDDRPKKLESKAGSGYLLQKFKRVKK